MTETSPAAPAKRAADARTRYDQLVKERARLPKMKRDALNDEDPDAFFRAERRLSVIDGEILDAQKEIAIVEVDAAWDEAHKAHGQYLALQKEQADAKVKLERLRDVDPDTFDDIEAEVRHEVDVRTTRDLIASLDIGVLDARENAGHAIRLAEEADERYEAAIGEPPPTPNDGIRAPMPVLHRHARTYRPDPSLNGMTSVERIQYGGVEAGRSDRIVELAAGDRPPRWARLWLTNPSLFKQPPDRGRHDNGSARHEPATVDMSPSVDPTTLRPETSR